MKSHTVANTRAALVIAITFTTLGLAIWLLPASVHVVGWEGDAASIVSLLPPVSRLWLVLSLTSALAFAVGVTASRYNKLPQLARIVVPLMLLLLWAFPFLPVLPEYFPLLLLFGGPVRWVVFALACLGCLLIAFNERIEAQFFSCPKKWTVFVVSLVIFTALGVHSKSALGLGGDEPHYLMIAQSLLADGDLRIENNHREHQYGGFFSGVLLPHFLRRGLDNTIYSIHSPGLPFLVLPFYALAGHWGAMILVALLASLAAATVFSLAQRLTSGPIAAITWAAVSFTVPFAPQSWLLFPEMPAALVMSCVAMWLWSPVSERPVTWMCRGAVIGFLPWLHMRYSVLLAGAVICLLIRLWPRIRLAVSMLIPLVISGILWFGSFYVMYGTVNPTVVYGYDAGSNLQAANIPRGVLGLLFDQEYGLLIYSPIYLLVGLGCWLMLRKSATRWQFIGLIATTLVYVCTVTQYYMWWAGWSVPARFLVPVLPLMAPMLAVAIDRCRGTTGRGVVSLLLLISIGIFAVAMYEPVERILFNDRDGTGQLIESFQGGTWLTTLLPTFIEEDWRAQLPKLLRWSMSSVVAFSAALLIGRRARSLQCAFWSGVSCLVCFVFVGSVLHAGTSLDVQSESEQRGRLSLLEAYDGNRLQGYDYRGGRVLNEASLFQMAHVFKKLNEPQWFDGRVSSSMPKGAVTGPFSFPPGRYVVRVEFLSIPDKGEVWLAYHRGPGLLTRGSTGTMNVVSMIVDSPIALDPVWLGASTEELAKSILSIEIIPERVIPRSDRFRVPNIWFAEAIDSELGQHVFHLDNQVWVEPEGFWIRGGSTASVLVSPAGESSVLVSIQNGAEPGTVTIEFSENKEIAMFNRFEIRQFRVQVDGESVVQVDITPANGFRPSLIDSESQDERWLGSFVRFSFE